MGKQKLYSKNYASSCLEQQKNSLELIAKELPRGFKNPVNFYSENEFSCTDISIKIEGIGDLDFIQQGFFIETLLKFCTKVRLGESEEILHYQIPTESLMVLINQCKFAQVLDKIRFDLGFADSSQLEAQQGKIFIHHRSDRFCDFHPRTKRSTDVVGTLMIILPFPHLGGNLVIQHGTEQHTFISENLMPGNFKCIGFHADCRHRVEKVNEGFQVALTYKLILKSECNAWPHVIYPKLICALQSFFGYSEGDDIDKKFVCMLHHSYTEYSLKWHMLRGEDQIKGDALLAVAKSLDLQPYLAQVNIRYPKSKNNEARHCDSPVPISVKLTNLISFSNEKQELKNPVFTSKEEIGWDQETLASFEHDGLYNEGFDVEKHRAAVVMWSSAMKPDLKFKFNLSQSLKELQAAIKSPEKEKEVCEFVKKQGDYLHGKRRNKKKDFLFLTKIALYIKDEDLSTIMFSNFGWEILNYDIVESLALLDRQYGSVWSNNLLDIWKNSNLGMKRFINAVHKFVSRYLSFGGSAMVLETILNEQLSNILKKDSLLNKKQVESRIELFSSYLISCILIRNLCLIGKTLQYINSNKKIFTDSVKIKLYLCVKKSISSAEFVYLEPLWKSARSVLKMT